jgi:DNA mismatch endonuclease (patch repair protein)
MSRIRSKWTKQEKLVHEALDTAGVRHKMHPELPGSPDLIVPAQMLAVYLNGCFWHKCRICYKPPKSNREYWLPKLDKNAERDLLNQERLKSSGWRVVVIWEHEIKRRSAEELVKLLESKGIGLPTQK